MFIKKKKIIAAKAPGLNILVLFFYAFQAKADLLLLFNF